MNENMLACWLESWLKITNQFHSNYVFNFHCRRQLFEIKSASRIHQNSQSIGHSSCRNRRGEIAVCRIQPGRDRPPYCGRSSSQWGFPPDVVLLCCRDSTICRGESQSQCVSVRRYVRSTSAFMAFTSNRQAGVGFTI